MNIAKLVGKALHSEPHTAAVILAAGCGSRMGNSAVTKQLRPLLSLPIAVRTMLAFEACPQISEIVLVVRREEEAVMRGLASENRIKKLSAIAFGGDTRQESAKNGFLALSKKAKFVAIHDAARCLILPEQISSVVKAAWEYRAASAVSPVYDTVKRVTREGFIEETIPRDCIYAAATPQVFECDLYAAALYAAEKRGDTVTDDNMLMEAISQAVKAVDCGRNNFKITTEEDLLLAEALLKGREEKSGD